MFTDFVSECEAHKAQLGYTTTTKAKVTLDIPDKVAPRVAVSGAA